MTRFQVNTLLYAGVLLGLLTASQASASTVFFGVFSSYAPDGARPVVTGISTPMLSWGDPSNFGMGPSSITYVPSDVSTDRVLSGQPFKIGSLTYHNGAIVAGTGISSAVFSLMASSDDPDLDTSGGFSEQLITESTPNTSNPRESADYLFFETFIHDDLANTFFNVYEGETATANILVRLDFLPDFRNVSTLAAAHRIPTLSVLGFADVTGGGFLTDVPVNAPEPNLGVLMAGSLGGILWLKRRRSVLHWFQNVCLRA